MVKKILGGFPLFCLISLAMIAGGCRKAESDNAGVAGTPQRGDAIFRDVADAAHLRYEWKIPGKRPLNILQTIGNGCAFLDYNGDRNLDILLIGSPPALFKGDGKGAFTDVSAETGIAALKGAFLGCAVGDYDNDGFDDVYLTAYRGGALLHNRKGQKFEDVTKAAGIAPQPWGTSAAFAETEPGNGRLDLFIGNYAEFGPTTEPQLCEEQGVLTSCGPRRYAPLRGAFYKNLGNGHFADKTATNGAATARGRVLGVAFRDFDGGGRPGFALGNDEQPGDLFQPKPGGAFTNIADTSGTAYDRDGNVHGGMGLDWGDFDGDGMPDLFLSTFFNEVKPLYRNAGGGVFSDVAFGTGIAAVSLPYVSFGCKFLDFDNDGNLDIAVANGHVQDNITQINPAARYKESALLLQNRGGQPVTFTEVSQSVGGPDFMRPIVGRGLATGDYDNDGRIDLLIVDSEGKPLLLHNESKGKNHFLGILLTGTRSNRNAYGAKVVVTLAGGRTLTRWAHADGSYMSSSDPRVLIGLGTAPQAEKLTVTWPDGSREEFSGVAGDRYIALRQGTKSVTPLSEK